MAAEFIESNRVCPSAQEKAELGLYEVPVETAKNALVISNNRGFHKRGTIQPGQVREQFRMLFHYLEEPLYATLLWHVARKLARRGLLPRKLNDLLLHRGLL